MPVGFLPSTNLSTLLISPTYKVAIGATVAAHSARSRSIQRLCRIGHRSPQTADPGNAIHGKAVPMGTANPRPGKHSVRIRPKDTDTQLTGDMANCILRPHAVAKLVEPRRKRGNRHLARYHRNDAAANAGL